MTEQQEDHIRSMWIGCLWFVLGVAVIMVVLCRRRAHPADPLERSGPLVPLFAGAYGVVVGLEKMFSGYGAARASSRPQDGARAKRALALCGLLVVATLGAGGYTYLRRNSIEEIDR